MNEVTRAEEISNIAFGFMASKALFVALHCNIFTLLSKNPMNSEKLSKMTAIPENRISTICTALTSIGLLNRKDQIYYNSKGAEKFLVKGSEKDFGDYLRFQIDRQMYGFMGQLENVITGKDSNIDIDSYAKWMENEEEANIYSKSQHAGSIGPGKTLSKIIDFSKYKNMLDVAGGTGAFAIELCKKYPSLTVQILDFSNVIKIGKTKVMEERLSDRISFIEADALEYNWPKDNDIILMSYLFNGVPGEEIPKLISNAYNNLNNNGILIVHDFMVKMDRSGPHLAALWQLQHLAFTPMAKSITSEWIFKLMSRSGFKNIKKSDLIPDMTKIVWGKK